MRIGIDLMGGDSPPATFVSCCFESIKAAAFRRYPSCYCYKAGRRRPVSDIS